MLSVLEFFDHSVDSECWENINEGVFTKTQIMFYNMNKGYSTIHTIRGILRPAFRQAYDDDLIRRNPFDFELATVIVNDSVIREARSYHQGES